jgi:hypothetical protein
MYVLSSVVVVQGLLECKLPESRIWTVFGLPFTWNGAEQ